MEIQFFQGTVCAPCIYGGGGYIPPILLLDMSLGMACLGKK